MTMGKKVQDMGALAIRRLEGDGLHSVGHVPGLSICISSTGSKTWIYRTTVQGKRTEIGLGGYPAVGLA